MTRSSPNAPIAIVGMACRLPGAEDLDQLWRLVYEGRKAFGPVPADRFDRDLYFDPRRTVLGKSYTDLGGTVSYGPFDHRTSPVPEDAVGKFDLAQLTLCDTAADACRHAGMDPRAMPYSNTGVYVGHARGSALGGDVTYAAHVAEAAEILHETPGFAQLPEGLRKEIICDVVDQVRRECPQLTPSGPFLGASLAAGLISRFLRLDGPYMAFNAACASSLHALVQAVRALQLGRIDMAIVGGASYFHSDTLVLFSLAQSLTSRGSCPFSADADGLVVAEGYSVLVLKTLQRALADKDRVLAVIPSVSISTDGRGKSLWAPRKEGQIEAIRRAYSEQVPIRRVQYIEAHATSTALGDATELTALSEVLKDQLPPGTKIPLGSIKANLGHTLEAAGATAVLKVVLALQHRIIPPGIDADRPLNKQVDWDALPVFVPRKAMEWTAPADGHPRRAGVNAFGIGGMNVHVVVDEFLPQRSGSLYLPAAAPRTATPVPAGSPDDQAIAVVGMGAVFPGARTIEAFWDLLCSGRDARTEVPAGRWNSDLYCGADQSDPWRVPTSLGGYITDFQYDWRKHRIPPKQIEQASPLQFMILDAVDQAIQQAGYHQREFDRRRTGVVVGTIFGGDFAAQLSVALQLPPFKRTLAQVLRRHGVPEDRIAPIAEAYQAALLEHMPAFLDETGSFTASALASRITKSFDLMGGGVAVDAGSASSMAALSCSIDLLLAGNCDMMICVGAQQAMSPLTYAIWKQLGGLASGPAAAPFDAQAAGAVPGEGCGAVLLKRLADARRDGDHVFAVVRGIGAAFSGSRSRAIELAIRRALAGSGLSGSDLALLETTGAGHAALDAEELQAVLGACRTGRRRPIRVGTVVGQIGNTSGASGMASLLKATLELEHRQSPAVASLKAPAGYAQRDRNLLEVPVGPAPVRPANPVRPEIAGVNSCGANEVVYHVVMERGSPVKSSVTEIVEPSEIESVPAPVADDALSSVVYFDATARRRESMRRRAAEQGPGREMPVQVPSSNGSRKSASAQLQARPEAPFEAVPAAPRSRPPQVRPQRSPAPVLAAVAEPAIQTAELRVSRPAPSNPPAPAPVPSQLATPAPAAPVRSAKELETFLVNFVVEQTGYPPEIVELDADLEADLGIDSIKKAQLFGELGQYFDVKPDANLTLDDFPTLRHVLDYLLPRVGSGASSPTPAPVDEAALVATPAPAAPAPAAPARSPKELETFLVNFVVEQTGYPPEIVELDADLEADLGIDSIKKAQLFGELGQYFDVKPDANLTLDDFPTLRHVLDYLVTRVGGGSQSSLAIAPEAKPIAAPAPAVPTPAAPARSPKELETFFVNFVVEQTGYPPEIVELDADLEADLGIDSIKKAQLFGELGQYFDVKPDANLTLDDFPTLRHVLDYLVPRVGADRPAAAPAAAPVVAATPPTTPEPVPAALPAPSVDAKEIESFLVNFVVEQTGYPPEIVELDADLEADLGIDSIKKAQLFGELGQYFDVKPDANLTLDDFPTLRHVLDYLVSHVGKQPGAVSTAKEPPAAAVEVVATAPAAAPKAAGPARNRGELQAFLVNFVVEQTGYPPEIVELDADLEADLGIDSIKKAQLFGELGQYFDIKPDANLTLDDFPTLRHVLDYLVAQLGMVTAAAPAMPPVERAAKEPERTPEPSVAAAKAEVNDLQAFLVNFVVEQTGYPPEIVELDADLEADLGIDSIKKAQLFGELGQYFDVKPDADLTLDDFPTLRHVLDYLQAALSTR